MSNVANRYKLGVFVVAALAILLGVLFLLGFMTYFERKVKFMTIVQTSVQGLSTGAKVKYRGVPIGSVTDIKISPVEDFVVIYMEAFPSKLQDDKFVELTATQGDRSGAIKDFLDAEIRRGLRCQLRYEGITGNLYQEVTYFDPRVYPMPNVKVPKSADFYVPSAPPILVGNLLETINSSLLEISKIEFNKISSQFIDALEAANKILNSNEINNILKEIQNISANVGSISATLRETLTKERINSVIDSLESTMAELRRLSEEARTQLEKSNIPETSGEARRLMRETIESLNDIQNLRRDLSDTLANFNEAMDTFDSLARSIETDPNSLIWGKHTKPVVPPGDIGQRR